MSYKKTGRTVIKNISLAAVLAAVAAVLQFLEFPIPFLIPDFVKFDFSDIPAIFASFALGPVYGICVCLVKNVIHLIVTSSAGIGELANFLMGAFFVLPAGIIYKYKKTRAAALTGVLIGSATGGVMSFPINLFITYPFYTRFMPIEQIMTAYNAIFNCSTELWQVLLIFNMPFTIFKYLICSLITFYIYKPLSPFIKRFIEKT